LPLLLRLQMHRRLLRHLEALLGLLAQQAPATCHPLQPQQKVGHQQLLHHLLQLLLVLLPLPHHLLLLLLLVPRPLLRLLQQQLVTEQQLRQPGRLRMLPLHRRLQLLHLLAVAVAMIRALAAGTLPQQLGAAGSQRRLHLAQARLRLPHHQMKAMSG
jgi:hypothetical protein